MNTTHVNVFHVQFNVSNHVNPIQAAVSVGLPAVCRCSVCRAAMSEKLKRWSEPEERKEAGVKLALASLMQRPEHTGPYRF